MEPIGTDPGNLVSSLFPESNRETKGLFARAPLPESFDAVLEESLSYSFDSLQLSLREPGQGSLDLFVSLFEMNYQSVRAIQGANGEQGIERTAFFAQALKIEYRATGTYAADPEGAIGKLREAFTPEKTARRILDFALSRYGAEEGSDTPESRAAYRDTILPAVERGYQEALGLLGALPEEIRSELEATIRRVRELFDAFIRDGKLPEEDAALSEGEASPAAETDLVS